MAISEMAAKTACGRAMAARLFAFSTADMKRRYLRATCSLFLRTKCRARST